MLIWKAATSNDNLGLIVDEGFLGHIIFDSDSSSSISRTSALSKSFFQCTSMQTITRGNMPYFIDCQTMSPDGWCPANNASLEGLRVTIRARRELMSTCRLSRLVVLEAWKRDFSAIHITVP